jgi:hypothetical protein
VDSSIILPTCASRRAKARALASRIAIGNRLTGAPRRRNDQNKSKHG